MCDACSDFLELLVSYERQVCKESNDQHVLTKQHIDIVLLYVQSWPTRQCMCCYRDPKNFERFSLITQGIICLAVCYLKDIRENGIKLEKTIEIEEKKTIAIVEQQESNANANANATTTTSTTDQMKFHNSEKLLNLISKIFLLNFPLYAAFKHSMQSKLEEVTQQELQNLNTFCDLHDSEIPIYLLRNVCLFCKTGGVHAMTLCFQYLSPDTLPVSTAHAGAPAFQKKENNIRNKKTILL